jgi:hypothetical protein
MHRLAIVVLLLGFSTLAQAHYLWFERTGDAVRVYFGEWQDGLRESDSGPMRAIQGLRISKPDGQEVPFERKQDHFLVPAAPAGDLYAYDEVMHRSAKVVYDIKGGRLGTRAVAGFELVPEAPNSNTLMLMLDGKPLPKAEVRVFGPPKWEKHYVTDGAGRLTIETPWKGFYVLRASYDDETSGEFEGKKFDKIINVAILSFDVNTGLDWKEP